MLSFLPPRTFTDFTVPNRADGTVLTACEQPDDYERYVYWLADYLFELELPLSEEQRQWLKEKDRKPGSIIFECSDAFGYALWELETIQQAFEAGDDWASYRAFMHKTWEDDQEFPFEEWMCCEESDFNRIRGEWAAEKEAGRKWSHADIPFRPLLAWALKQIPDKKERIQELNRFFENFSENAGK